MVFRLVLVHKSKKKKKKHRTFSLEHEIWICLYQYGFVVEMPPKMCRFLFFRRQFSIEIYHKYHYFLHQGKNVVIQITIKHNSSFDVTVFRFNQFQWAATPTNHFNTTFLFNAQHTQRKIKSQPKYMRTRAHKHQQHANNLISFYVFMNIFCDFIMITVLRTHA